MFHLSKAALPAMIAKGAGSIINIASSVGVTALGDRFAYVTTKHAVVGMTKAWQSTTRPPPCGSIASARAGSSLPSSRPA